MVLEENPCIVKLANSWVLMNPGGPPTPDKPDISVVNYESGNTVSSFMNLRVADIQACYEQWSSRGPSSSPRRSIAVLRSAATCETPRGSCQNETDASVLCGAPMETRWGPLV